MCGPVIPLYAARSGDDSYFASASALSYDRTQMNSFCGRFTNATLILIPNFALVGMMCSLNAASHESIIPRLTVYSLSCVISASSLSSLNRTRNAPILVRL